MVSSSSIPIESTHRRQAFSMQLPPIVSHSNWETRNKPLQFVLCCPNIVVEVLRAQLLDVFVHWIYHQEWNNLLEQQLSDDQDH